MLRRSAWSWYGCLAALVLLSACARGSAELVTEGRPIAGDDAGPQEDDGGPGDDAMVAPSPNMDGGQDPMGPPDGGNPSTPDAGGDAQVPHDGRPVLSDIEPASVAVSPPSAVNITVLGSNFVARSVVQADGAGLVTTFVSNTELRAVLPQTLLTSIKTIRISVYTSAPGGGTSAATRDFRVVTSVPVLTSVAPTWAHVGAQATELVAAGSGFLSGAVLVFDNNDVPASSVTATELRASVPATLLATGRSALVRVRNPGTSGGISGSRPFEVRNLPCSVSAIAPTKAMINTQVSLTLTGTGLVAGSTVRVNGGSARTPSSANGIGLVVSIPASDLSAAGSANLTVTVPAPVTPGMAECTVSLPVEYAAPALTSISPNPITAGANDTVLTVTGTGFYAGSSKIRLDGVDAPNTTTCTSTTQCRTTLPASYLANGKSVAVTVLNASPGGGSSNAITLAINNPSPVLTTVAPGFVAQGSASQTLTLTGSGFVAGSVVRMTPKAGGSASVLTPATQTPTQLTVSLSAAFLASAAAYDVTVENPAPSGGPSAARTFTVWSGSCPTSGIDLPVTSTGVIAEYDLSWASATTSTGIYGGSSSCGTTLNPSVKRKFRPVVVQNNTPSAVVLSAWGKCASNDAAWLAFYKGTTVPVTDAELSMCNGKIGQGVGIYGAPAADSGGTVSCPGLMKADNAGIRLEACEAVVVYMQMQSTTGAVPAKLRVRADVP